MRLVTEYNLFEGECDEKTIQTKIRERVEATYARLQTAAPLGMAGLVINPVVGQRNVETQKKKKR